MTPNHVRRAAPFWARRRTLARRRVRLAGTLFAWLGLVLGTAGPARAHIVCARAMAPSVAHSVCNRCHHGAPRTGCDDAPCCRFTDSGAAPLPAGDASLSSASGGSPVHALAVSAPALPARAAAVALARDVGAPARAPASTTILRL
jgi:hypothetical protein